MVLETTALPTELYPCTAANDFISVRIYGGEDGIRTHAALANPNDLANRPLQPLEYFSRLNIIYHMAERVGFEPTVPCGITGFQDRLLKPLGHLSSCCYPIQTPSPVIIGDPSEIRTPDTLIKSQVLCRLS